MKCTLNTIERWIYERRCFKDFINIKWFYVTLLCRFNLKKWEEEEGRSEKANVPASPVNMYDVHAVTNMFEFQKIFIWIHTEIPYSNTIVWPFSFHFLSIALLSLHSTKKSESWCSQVQFTNAMAFFFSFYLYHVIWFRGKVVISLQLNIIETIEWPRSFDLCVCVCSDFIFTPFILSIFLSHPFSILKTFHFVNDCHLSNRNSSWK